MGEYRIVFARSARKEVDALPSLIASRVLNRVRSLTVDPRPPGCKKLAVSHNLWRVRVGDYRVIYSIDDAKKLVDVVAVRHRSEAY